jgi:NADH:ubiquinone oxidoreductase subunit E
MSAPACSDPGPLRAILARYPAEEPSLIQVLQEVQRAYRYLPCEALAAVAEALHVPLARVVSVATFYRAFAHRPQGRLIVKVCTGTACHIRGADLLLDALSRRLGVGPGETTPDLGFTLQTVNCVGACAMAPVVIAGERYHGHAQQARLERILEDGAGQ